MRQLSLTLAFFGLFTFNFHFDKQKSAAEKSASEKSEIRNPKSEIVYPKDYFASPVAHPIRLSGTFGELRPDHFHGGLDIKPKANVVGDPVFAAADGFVYRIVTQPGGYGRALYLRHPNGFSTVYAHLDHFSPEIDRFVKSKQYEKESFRVDLEPSKDQFSFKKGQQIAVLGNSGGSAGPHLHFEIRQTGTDHTLNPLLFGLPVADQTPPQLREIRAYFLSEDGRTYSKKILALIKEKGVYRIKGDTVRLGAWRVAFGLKAYDFQTGSDNALGLFEAKIRIDGADQFAFRAEQIDFDETRFCNAHLDYQAKKASGAYIHRLWQLHGDGFSGYEKTGAAGVAQLFKDQARRVEIEATDAFGNVSKVVFWVKRDDAMVAQVEPPHNYVFRWDAENRLEKDGLRLKLSKNALYENVFATVSQQLETGWRYSSAIHHVHDDDVPVHSFFDLAIRPNVDVPIWLRPRVFLANLNGSAATNAGGKWDGEWFESRVRSLGSYALLIDSVAPTIKPILFKTDLSKSEKMSFSISDNFDTTGKADGLDWRAEVDGNWILMEFDSKKGRLTHIFDQKTDAGEHRLRLRVVDDRGNAAVFEGSFRR